jgi:uncharacterized membrane protein YqjE
MASLMVECLAALTVELMAGGSDVRTVAQLVARSVVLMVEWTVALTVVYLAEQKVDLMAG